MTIEKNNTSHLECTLSDSDLFTPAFVQSDIEHGYFEDIFPITKLDDSGPIEFLLENATDKFLDLANTYLKLKLKIVKGDGSDTAEIDKVTPINYTVSSLFSQVDVNLGGRVVSMSTNTYSYRSIIETLLNFGSDAKKSQLSMAMYTKDQAGRLDDVDPARNSGLSERFEHFKGSRTVEIYGRIHSDLFNQGRLILNGLPLKIVMHRNKSTFALLAASGSDYKILSTEALLCVRKVRLTPHKFQEIQQNLEKVPAVYPINRVDVKTYSVAAGLTSLNWDNAFQGQIPNRIFVGMVENVSFTGQYDKNPYNFKHFNLSSIGIYVNGASLPAHPIKCNFDNNFYLNGYHSLFTTTGKFARDEGLDILRTDYKNGYTLFGFDISPASCNGGHQELIKRGTVRISIDFDAALPNSVTVIAYADFDNHITIDRNRSVLKNY